MSSISSVGGSDLYQLFSTGQSQGTNAAGGTEDGSSTGKAKGHGGHHRPPPPLSSSQFQQVQDAVTTALQSAQQSGSSDPNQVVQDAIEQVFKNGVSGSSSSSTSASGSTDPSSSTTSNSTSSTNASAQDAFTQTLQASGIDPQQFQQDLVTAIQNARNGSTDASTAFQNLPLGTVVDTLG